MGRQKCKMKSSIYVKSGTFRKHPSYVIHLVNSKREDKEMPRMAHCSLAENDPMHANQSNTLDKTPKRDHAVYSHSSPMSV